MEWITQLDQCFMARPKRFELLTPKFVLVLAPLGRRLGQITKLNGFHGRNHGPGNAVQNKPMEFRKADQHYSMVGAVGIEPTTSPV